MYLVGEYVSEWVDEPGRLALRGETATAETLLRDALVYHPESKKARYRLGRHCFDFGEEKRGLQVLRENSMLVDMPRFDRRHQRGAYRGRLVDADTGDSVRWIVGARSGRGYQRR